MIGSLKWIAKMLFLDYLWISFALINTNDEKSAVRNFKARQQNTKETKITQVTIFWNIFFSVRILQVIYEENNSTFLHNILYIFLQEKGRVVVTFLLLLLETSKLFAPGPLVIFSVRNPYRWFARFRRIPFCLYSPKCTYNLLVNNLQGS